MTPLSPKSLIVNALTLSRVPLIFVYLVFAILGNFSESYVYPLAAILAGAAAGISDFFDGMLARRWCVVSDFGKMADPLMDKVYFIVAFPSLVWLAAVQGESPAHAVTLLVFTILWILRDQWVTFLRAIASLYHADVAAMWLGKVRTALSFPGAGWIYLYLAFHGLAPESWNGPWLASCYLFEAGLVALTLVSLVTYTAAYAPYLEKALARK